MTGRLEVDVLAPAPVGAFVQVSARLEAIEDPKLRLVAEAVGEGGVRIAVGRGTFVRVRVRDPER